MKKHRFTGTPELWYNEDRNIFVIRKTKYGGEALYLEKSEYWKYVAFKEQGSFDFINASKYLQEKGFEMIERLK